MGRQLAGKLIRMVVVYNYNVNKINCGSKCIMQYNIYPRYRFSRGALQMWRDLKSLVLHWIKTWSLFNNSTFFESAEKMCFFMVASNLTMLSVLKFSHRVFCCTDIYLTFSVCCKTWTVGLFRWNRTIASCGLNRLDWWDCVTSYWVWYSIQDVDRTLDMKKGKES